MLQPIPSAVLRPTSAAEYLQISRSTLYRLISNGHLQLVHLSPRTSGVTAESINAYLTRIGNES